MCKTLRRGQVSQSLSMNEVAAGGGGACEAPTLAEEPLYSFWGMEGAVVVVVVAATAAAASRM